MKDVVGRVDDLTGAHISSIWKLTTWNLNAPSHGCVDSRWATSHANNERGFHSAAPDWLNSSVVPHQRP
jgi:hypothetical protein